MLFFYIWSLKSSSISSWQPAMNLMFPVFSVSSNLPQFELLLSICQHDPKCKRPWRVEAMSEEKERKRTWNCGGVLSLHQHRGVWKITVWKGLFIQNHIRLYFHVSSNYLKKISWITQKELCWCYRADCSHLGVNLITWVWEWQLLKPQLLQNDS